MDVTHKKVTEIAAYQGPHEIPGIRFRHARRELGVTAWGMNAIEIDPHNSSYPEHDHAADGQEEVYVVLEGRVDLLVEGLPARPLERGSLVRVPPELKRRFVTHDSAVTLLALGGTPGQVYEVKDF